MPSAEEAGGICFSRLWDGQSNSICSTRRPRAQERRETTPSSTTSWRLKTGGEGLLFRPTCATRGGTQQHRPTFMRQHTLRRHLSLTLASYSLPFLTWYQATRHTFASHWVLSGGSLEKQARVMGHSSMVVTKGERKQVQLATPWLRRLLPEHRQLQ